MIKRFRRIFFFLAFILYLSEAFSQLYINEIQAYNASSYLERWWGDFPDWIELYNGGNAPVDLSGYYITDDINIPTKWKIHSGTIYPGGFELLFADKVGYRMHTNFSLDGNGEQILLFTPEMLLMDSISFGAQHPDISYGRYPDGSQNWTFFEENTPNKANSPLHMSQPAFTTTPQFSLEGGFYAGNLTISLSTSTPTAMIRYSMDGSDPGPESAIYSEPITISSTTVIRAKVFEEGVFSGATVTHSYIFDTEKTLPVISISMNKEYLWDDQVGIYVVGTNGITSTCMETPANYYQDWERPINIEYFDQNGNPGFNQMAGTKIFGACSRRASQKSMSIFARGKYGKKEFDYKLFKDKEIDKFKSFIIRNSGNDVRHTMLRDGMMQNLVKDRMDVDYQEFQPAIIYLNGDYWGILNIREKINEDYLSGNHGVDADSVDLLFGHVAVVEGSDTQYQQMMDFVRSNDMADPENYSHMESQMDMNQYLNYQIAQIYYFNQDWPQGNIKYWRPQTQEGRWRWLLYDLDFGFDFKQFTDNMVTWVSTGSQAHTELFRELLSSDEFRNEFLQRFCSHMNTTFQPDRVIGIIDSLAGNIEVEMPAHIDKFFWPRSMSDWYDELRTLTDFAENRLPVLTGHLQERFELEGTFDLYTQVSDPDHGRIQICGVDVPAQFSGPYFVNLPLSLKAIPAEGWTFLGWQGASNSVNSEIELNLSGDASITAIFGPAEPLINIRINELSSHVENGIQDENGQVVDWIEFYNSGTKSVNMAGLYLSDNAADLSKFKVPSSRDGSTLLYPDSSLVFYADNDPEEGPLHLNFKLSNKGETIVLSQLIENELMIIDSVCFPGQFTGSTAGMIPDGTGVWQMTYPTPGNSNEPMPSLSGLYINEFSASNQTIMDPSGEYNDWIEIYNDNDVAINIGGLFMTDSLPDGRKYRIPSLYPDSTTIQAKDHLILWADNQEEKGILHLGFGLKRKGEQIGLVQYNGIEFIDSMTFDEQFPAASQSRFPDGKEAWYHLPSTPGKENVYPSRSGLYITEFSTSNNTYMSDSFGEYEDWIEIYNDNDWPVDIGGLFVSDSLKYGMKSRIPSTYPDSTLIPPKGYLVLWADNQPEQGVLHLNFKLSRQGEQLGLFQYNGIDFIDSLTYGKQYANASVSRYEGDNWYFVPSTPGMSNYRGRISKIYINEYSSSNQLILTDNYGEYNDWIELYNDNDQPVDVGGLYLTDSLASKAIFRIPTTAPDSTTIPPKGYLLLWADKDPNQGVLHLDFSLKREEEQIGLLDFTGITYLDSLSYEKQYANASMSFFPDEEDHWIHVPPTPGKKNEYHPVTGLFINEFSSSNSNLIKDKYGEYDDWIEIYNDNNTDVDIGGLYITDSLGDGTRYRIPTTDPDSTTIAAKDFKILWADKQDEQGILHLDFGLSSEGEQIGLLQYNGRDIIDSLSYQEVKENTSISRYPDGFSSWLSMNSTPGRNNTKDGYSRLCINEFKAGDPANNSTTQYEEGNWIELFNNNEYDLDVGGLYMTNDLAYPNKYWIPDTSSQLTLIPPKGHLLLWSDNKDEEGELHMNFTLDQEGIEIGLARKVNNEYFYLDTLVYFYQSNSVSTGRVKDGVNSWTNFSNPTPGRCNSNTLTAFPSKEVIDFQVYPNPVSNGMLYFNDTRSVELYNHLGTLVKMKMNAGHLNVTSFPPGFYFLKTDRGELIRIVII